MTGLRTIVGRYLRRGRYAVGALALCTVLAVGTWASALDDHLALGPLMALREAAGAAPPLPADFRIVVQEDRSRQKLGRTVTFAEWYAIAGRLFALGFERVIFLGLHDDALKDPPLRLQTTQVLVAGGVVVPLANPRARTPEPAVRRWFYPPLPGAPPAGILAPPLAAGAIVDRVGALNAAAYLRLDTRYPLGPAGTLLPMALLVRDDWQPATLPKELLIDYSAVRSIQEAALPVSAFFDEPTGTLAEALAPKAAARLAGGKVAFLVPEGYTGARFVESPVGTVLSHYPVVSVAAGAAAGRLLVPAAHPALLVLAFSLLFAAAMSARRPRHAYPTGALLLVLGGAATVAALMRAHLALPAGQAQVVAAVLLLARAAQDLHATYRARVALAGELELGRKVQSIVLPRAAAGTVGPWDWRFVYRPYGAMGGDWYQTHLAADGERAVFAFGDVVGKGASAALATAVIASAFKTVAASWGEGTLDPDGLIRTLEAAIHRTFEGQQNSTVAVVVVEPGRVRFLAAGMAPFLVFEPGAHGAKPRRSAPANPLGLAVAEERRENAWHELAVGAEVLFGATDGLIDGLRMASDLARQVTALAASQPVGADTFDQVARALAAAGCLPDDATSFALTRRQPGAKSAA